MQCYINRNKTVRGILDPEEYEEDLQQLALGNKEPFQDLITTATINLLETLGIPEEFVTGPPKVAIFPDHVVIELQLSDAYVLPEDPTGARQSVFKFTSMSDVIACCHRLSPKDLGATSLYKQDSVYYLVMSCLEGDLLRTAITAGEYGEFVEVFPRDLTEHSKLIIEDTAVQDLHSL